MLYGSLALLATGLLAWLLLVLWLKPANHRDWSPDQARLATVDFDGDRLVIDNVRNAHYRSVSDYDVRWEPREYDLSNLQTVWLVIEPFADWRGPAHTFLSFGFDDGQYLAISVEIRKERGEEFSPLRGLFRQYELIYIAGDERDLIGLRANHRKDAVYLYPIRTTEAGRRELLVSFLLRMNELAAAPEFYNTISNNCTTNIIDHIERIAPGSIPLSYRTYFPGYADDLRHDLGMLDTDLPVETYRQAHRINDRAEQFAERADFSERIRERLGTL